MYGWYKVIAEKEDFIEISYSIGKIELLPSIEAGDS